MPQVSKFYFPFNLTYDCIVVNFCFGGTWFENYLGSSLLNVGLVSFYVLWVFSLSTFVFLLSRPSYLVWDAEPQHIVIWLCAPGSWGFRSRLFIMHQ